MYEAEAAHLRAVFLSELISIHHIGSTSVHGLKAKPIIDIMVVINDIATIHGFDAGMIALGYRPRGECLDSFGTPGRFYFSKNSEGVRTHQVHVMEEGHFDIERKLNFRDYLRAHSSQAEAYGFLKERLAAENTRGIVEYIEGKNAFVEGIIAESEGWKSPR